MTSATSRMPTTARAFSVTQFFARLSTGGRSVGVTETSFESMVRPPRYWTLTSFTSPSARCGLPLPSRSLRKQTSA